MEVVKYDDVLQLKNIIFDCIDVTDNTRKEYLTRIKHFIHFVKLHGINFNTYLEYERYLSFIDTISVFTKNKYLISAKILLIVLIVYKYYPFRLIQKFEDLSKVSYIRKTVYAMKIFLRL